MERRNPSHKWTTQTAAAIYYDTFWLQSFGTRNSSMANAKIYVFCFILNLRAISKPPEAYIWRGDLKEGFWRGLFSEFYGITNVTPFIKSTVYVSYIVPSTEPRFLYGEGGVRVRLFEGGAYSKL